MNKNFVVAAAAGGVVLWVLGFLFYGVALMEFFQSNAGSATGVMKETPDWLWLTLGQVAAGALLATVLGWKGVTDPASGAKAGALFGLLMSLAFGLTMFGTANISNLTATLVDPIVAAVMFGAAGVVVGMLLGRDGE